MNWKQRFDRMKQYFGLTHEDIAKITGNSTDSVRTVLNRREIPRWAKLAVWVFEKLKEEK
jgi:hypothetical protein